MSRHTSSGFKVGNVKYICLFLYYIFTHNQLLNGLVSDILITKTETKTNTGKILKTKTI